MTAVRHRSAQATRTRKSVAARVRPFSIPIVLVVIGLAVAAYYGAQWPGFHPRHIVVRGTMVVSKDEVLQRAALAPDRNIWLQNTGAAAARIASLPYVNAVQIRRRLPAEVTILIQERKPFAIVEDDGARVLVDDHLHVLDVNPLQTNLPLLHGKIANASVGMQLTSPQLMQLARDCKALLHASVPVAYLNLDRLGNLNARLSSGVLVEFGDDADIAQKARIVNPVLSQVPQIGRKVRALDLRAAKTPVVVFAH